MTIFDKVIEIYRDTYICSHCLGRMFSLLGTDTTNHDRGNSLLLAITMDKHRAYLSQQDNRDNASQILKLLAENAKFTPAQSVLKKEGIEYIEPDSAEKCYLCYDIFNNINVYAKRAEKYLENLEFTNFLIGTALDAHIINNEDNFKATHNLLEAESFKNHFNREVGKDLSLILGKPAEFGMPDITIIYSIKFGSFDISLLLRSLFVYGRYNKFVRGIPQTHWNCRLCRGRGCESCKFTGKQYPTSVEELISPKFVNEAKADGSKFHGAGREDIDVRMLGNGRPFILELNNPKIRTLDLIKIQNKVNKSNKRKIKVSDLKYSSKERVKNLKFSAENTKKVYKAIVISKEKISKDNFDVLLKKLKSVYEQQKLQQRTPIRVSHRRADKIREKKIFRVEGKFIKPNLSEFIVEAQGGTYIKELISGDNGRTTPSFSDVYGFSLECKKLDVLKIY
ncbi:MAG: tRNA pseudouridine(54/55) synthase Pus10 [Candidatus Lokiarchaeota archaeon]|nr:tRNA pseudouridine(54/55) synthase Pus10 [Candidatus Lokiarchaeota archaeon]